MLYLLDRVNESEEALERACELAPTSYDFRLMLALLYEKQTKWEEALTSIDALLELRPGDLPAQQVRQRIMQTRRGQ